jgi:branched-chain amino acid transport system substrate-binding protein
MRASRLGLACTALAMSLATISLTTATQAADKLTIGFMATLSGPAAIIGSEIRDGMLLGLDHLDNKVGGLPTKMIVEDDQQKPDVALQLVNKFQKSDRVDLMAGFGFSNLLLAVYGPIVKSEMIFISANPGPSQIAGKDCSPYFFSTSWQGDNWAEAMGAHLTKKGLQNVYLMAPNYAAGKDVIAGFKRHFKGTIAGEVYTPLTQLDFAAELAQLKSVNPSATFAFYPGGLGVQFVKQYSQAGLKDKYTLYTSYTVDNTTIPAIGEDAVGLVKTTFWNPDNDNPANKKFIEGFRAKFKRMPAEYAVQGYDTIMLLDSAVKAVNGKIEDKPALMAALKKADFKSIRGAFRFNNNQFPIQDFYQGRIVKHPDGRIDVKIEEVALKDHGDAYAAQCAMK